MILIQVVLRTVYHRKRLSVNICFCLISKSILFLHISYVEFHTYHTKIFYAIYDKVDMRELISDLAEHWPTEIIHQYNGKKYTIEKPILDPKHQNEIIHEYFWHKLPDFIPENSIIIAETGTPEFGQFN